MTNKTPSLKVHFYVLGESFSPSEFSKKIGIDASESGCKGENWPGKDVKIPETFWSITINKDCYSVDEAVSEVLELIWSSKDKFKEEMSAFDTTCTIVCNVTINSERPVYDLKPNTIEKISFFGAEFNMDIFDYSK